MVDDVVNSTKLHKIENPTSTVAQDRYVHNPAFQDRKEKDGFLCATVTRKGAIFTNCVAVKRDEQGVHIRDTKDLTDNTLHFTNSEWDAFLQGIKRGEFNI